MQSKDITVQQLFQERIQYMVPFYQRAYVWNQEDQWEQLWEDIQSKADARLFSNKTTPHFLGAVVLDRQPRLGVMGVDTLHIIDGQQRLTTLQFILKSILFVLQQNEPTKLSEIVYALLFNPNPDTMCDSEIEKYKVWPTFRDRENYISALNAKNTYELRIRFPDSFTQRDTLRIYKIHHPPALEAIWFFLEKIKGWISKEERSKTLTRCQALVEAVLQDLKLVSIGLSEEDDAQVIFETLNGRGAQLHATDLIRNFIFMRADKEGVNSGDLYKTHWLQFEAYYWNSEQTRGRMKKPRMEWFVHSCLVTELCKEIDLGRLYFEYRRYVFGNGETKTAEAQLITLSKYSEIYRKLLDGKGNSPIAQFGRRIVPYDVTTLHPLALLIASASISDEAKYEMLNMMVSYVARRAICGLTTKNYNNVFISIIRQLSKRGISPQTLRDVLSSLDRDASRWPRDGEFRNICQTTALYPGTVDAPKMRSILAEIETELRSVSKNEDRFDAETGSLDIEHILPSSWYEHWPLSNGEKVERGKVERIRYKQAIGEILDEREQSIKLREDSIGTLGNLTLLNLSVNREAQNKPFPEKKKLLLENTNLRLNVPLLGFQVWNEQTIKDRAKNLSDVALQIWPGIKE